MSYSKYLGCKMSLSFNKKYTTVVKIADLMDKYDLFLFDLWGVILESTNLYEGASEVVNHIISKKKLLFVSNTSQNNEDTAKKFQNYGLNVKEDIFMTAGEMAQRILKYPQDYFNVAQPIIYNFGQEHHAALWTKHNFSTTTDIASSNLLAISLCSLDKELHAETKEVFQIAAKNKIPAICTNNDRIAPAGNGDTLYCAGWFAEEYEKMGGKVMYCGKPFANIFEEALKAHPQIPKSKIVMIGDSLSTDVKGAANVGVDSALVLTGNMQTVLRNAKDETEKFELIHKFCAQNQTYPTHLIRLSL